MPTLNWIGREAVINHHNEIPYRLLRCNGELSVGDSGNGNLLVEGDNLEALKALLPYYAGQVKCIYIDPPYNTGNEDWVYSDSVSSPQMRAWLGKVVGRDDLSRDDKWLCMMYPRLMVLWQFLREDGVIFISIDDNEIANLRLVMNEVFGASNMVAILVWQKRVSPANDAQYFSSDHEYLMVYARSKKAWRPNRLKRSTDQLRNYRNPDNDPRGPWNSVTYTCNKSVEERPNLYHGIENPHTGEVVFPKRTAVWKYDRDTHLRHVEQGLIYWGVDGTSRMPRLKRFLSEVGDVVPRSVLLYSEYGHTQEARSELLQIIKEVPFTTPKPTRLIRRILQIATDPGDLILDSFAGSGTTGHAVLEMNHEDGGHRRFILVELEPEIARNITVERLRRAVGGYEFIGTERVLLFEHKLTVTAFKKASEVLEEMESIREQHQGEYDGFERRIKDGKILLYGKKKIEGFKEGLGGGFRYCTLGSPLFDETGAIRPEVSFDDLAAHIYFTETGEPLPQRPPPGSPLIGQLGDTAYYLLFNGVRGGSQLDARTLRQVEDHSGPVVVYADGCTLSATTLKQHNIAFKQIPYEVTTR